MVPVGEGSVFPGSARQRNRRSIFWFTMPEFVIDQLSDLTDFSNKLLKYNISQHTSVQTSYKLSVNTTSVQPTSV